jgi:hypothetical protein
LRRSEEIGDVGSGRVLIKSVKGPVSAIHHKPILTVSNRSGAETGSGYFFGRRFKARTSAFGGIRYDSEDSGRVLAIADGVVSMGVKLAGDNVGSRRG